MFSLESLDRITGEGGRIAIHPSNVKQDWYVMAMTQWPLPEPMTLALAEAQAGALADEVPVGAVVVHHGKVIAMAHNAPRKNHDPTAHAEILALRAAAQVLGNERLGDCDLWVTLEPCAMCAGAIAHARIARLYYGASDAKGGAVEHGARVFDQAQTLHKPEVYAGIGAEQAAGILRVFFKDRRD